MAKRELSSTLSGLKFMQRAAQREEKVKKEEGVKPEGSSTITRKCVVIMEGDPHPGAIVGRMSFQSFNPSIDKLNEEAANACQPDVSGRRTLSSENRTASEAADCLKVGIDNGDLKRKPPDIDSEPQYPNKSPKNGHRVQSSRNTSKASSKKHSKQEAGLECPQATKV